MDLRAIKETMERKSSLYIAEIFKGKETTV